MVQQINQENVKKLMLEADDRLGNDIVVDYDGNLICYKDGFMYLYNSADTTLKPLFSDCFTIV